jgi:hypothetical protein
MDRDADSPGAPGEVTRAEEEAWAEVASRWEEEQAHRDYLARFSDLEGLAEAGRRYRAALEARPGDPVATRWRDEILKRATARALAAVPPSSATHPHARWARYAGFAVAGVLLGAAAWLALGLLRAVSR